MTNLLPRAVLPFFLAGCAYQPTIVPGPCGSDKDCKLDRVCEAGQCVWPKPPDSSVQQTATVPACKPVPARTMDGPPAQAMFRFGHQHRGRSPFRIPRERPTVAWTYQTGGPVVSSPSVAASGMVFVGSHDKKLHAVDKAGKAAWTFAAGDLIWGTPAIDAAGNVYFGADDDTLYSLDGKSGAVRWKARIGSCQSGIGPEASKCDVDGGPTLGPDGAVYTGGDAIYAFNPDGSLRFRYATQGHVSSAPALMNDGTVVAGSQDNGIYAITKDGLKRWEYRARDDVESSPAIEEDGTIYIGSDDHRVYALSPYGQLAWALTTGDDVRASAAIGPDGTVYVGSFDGYLYAVRRDGQVSWAFRTGDRIISSALVDADGAVLVGSQDDSLYAIEPDGRMRWQVVLGGDVDSSPILAADGTIYVGSDDKKLYALRSP